MNIALKSLALALLVEATQLAGVAYALAPKAAGAPLVQSSAAKIPILTKAPEDWIIYDDTSFTPVVDDISRHLDAARKAFDAKDSKKAATEMRAVADELKLQAARAAKDDNSLVTADEAFLRADKKLAQDTVKRMNASALKVSAVAAAIDSGKIRTKVDLDRAIGKAARADMERRWLVTDVTTWYPVSEEPQRNFMDALAAYGRKDYNVAAADLHKATGYLRLEGGRATGAAKQALESSVGQLDKLAVTVEKGGVDTGQSLKAAFAKADHALALEHRAKASESWVRREYDKAGYELKAAGNGLESGAGWVGGEVKAGASATVADTRALGDKLASGATWTRDEVAKGFEGLGNGINALGQKIGSTNKAAPFNPGA